MKKKWYLVGLGVFTAACVLKSMCEYNDYMDGKIAFRVNNRQLKSTYIRDLKSELESSEVTLLDGVDISSCVTVDADTSIVENLSFIDYIKLKGKNIEIPVTINGIDIDGLKGVLREYNDEQLESLDAEIVFNKKIGRYEVKDEVYGDKVSIQSVVNEVQLVIPNLESIKLEDFRVEPKIKSEMLSDIVDKANRFLSWHVQYENRQSFEVPTDAVKIENNEVIIDDTFIKDIVKALEKEYDKTGQEREFVNHNGDTVVVSGGTWGTIMSSKLEGEKLTEMFSQAQSETNRKPIMIQEYTEISDTYIEISLDEQHLWVYIDGEMIMDTDVVTGDILKRRGTPTGTYFISECINGKYLTGDDYKVWVNKWMRLTNSGIGLHDASNRSRFGGNIYKGNGSHGCINLPRKFAYELFEVAYRGMPVIIY